MDMLSIEQIVVATLGAVLSIGFFFVMLLSRASITPRRLAGLLVIVLAFLTTVWAIGGATVRVDRVITFVATCTSAPANVGESVRRLKANAAARILLLDLGGGRCDVPAVAAAATLPISSVSITSIGSALGAAAPFGSPFGAALRKAVRDAASAFSVSTIMVLYDAAEGWWDRGFVEALRDPSLMDALGAEIYFDDLQGRAYSLQFAFIGTLQPVAINTIVNAVKLSLSGGPTSTSETLHVDLCFALDTPTDWKTCASSEEVLLLEGVPLRKGTRGSTAWEWEGSGVRTFQDLLFERVGASSGVQRCIPRCDRGLAAKVLSPGWHTIQVLARVRTRDQAAELAPVHSIVFVGATGATVIVGAIETLASRGWPAPFPVSGFARPLLQAAIANTPAPGGLGMQRLTNFPRPPPIPAGSPMFGDCIIRTDAPEDVLAACLNAARAVMLVEPEPPFLRDFAARASGPGGLLSRGTAITIAGVPNIAPGDVGVAASWLPAWPQASTSVVQTPRQLILLADCSGLAQMATDNTDRAMLDPTSPRAFTDQSQVIRALEEILGAVPDVTPVALGAAEARVVRFESKTTWQPSTTVGFAPGCLRNSSDEIRSQRELASTAVLEQRIDAFIRGDATPVPAPYPTFRLDGTRYPGSAIVVFATAAPQYSAHEGSLRRSGGAVVAGGLAPDWVASLPSPDLLARLKNADIKVIIVPLPTNSRFKEIADNALLPGERTWDEALRIWQANDYVVLLPRDDDPKQTARRIWQAIESPATSGIRREHFGRTLDPRVPDNIPAVPAAFRPLTTMEPSGSARRLMSLGSAYDSALLAAERNDQGAPVVALAYSPFDPISWASDIASMSAVSDHFTTICGTPCMLGGWFEAFLARTAYGAHLGAKSSALGIQRYLDVAAQSSFRASRTGKLTLNELRLSAVGDQLIARFQLPAAGAAWISPTIEVGNAPVHCGASEGIIECPMTIAAIDPVGRTATYTFSTTAGLPALPDGYRNGYPIRVDPKCPIAANCPAEGIVPFWLTKRSELSPDAVPFLNSMRAAGAVRATSPLPDARVSALSLATIVIALLTVILFSPLVRPWNAFARLLRIPRRLDSTAMFDVDFVSQLAGARPTVLEATRRAGDPAFMRRLQAGDSLSRAVAGDLALMTQIGRNVGAVTQLPRVRLREVGESFDLVIAIDDTSSLLLPGDVFGQSRKRFAALRLVSVICGTLMRQRGRFSIVALRGNTSFRDIDKFDDDLVETIFVQLFREGGSRDPIRSPAELPPTAVRLVVSDFLSNSPDEYAAWTQGARSAAIHIIDPEQAREIGVGRDARTGQVYDRSAWEVYDAAALLLRQAADVRFALEQSGATYVAVNVEMSNVEVATALSESGILNLVRQ